MNKANDRTAFPIVADSLTYICDPGMTLRDYFAAKALQAYIPVIQNALADKKIDALEICKNSYQWADIMLKAREEK